MWQKRKHKYGAKKAFGEGGLRFDSGMERALNNDLVAQERAGLIEIEARQSTVYLTDARIMMKPDFRVRDLKTGEVIHIECKGFETTDYRIKRRLWLSYGPTPMKIISGSAKNLVLKETLIPKIPARQHCPNCLCDKDNLSLGDAIND